MKHAFAFTQASLQGSLLGTFFINYATQYYIEHVPLMQRNMMCELIASTVHVQHHTNIVVLQRDDNGQLDVMELVWSLKMCLVGQELPMQCPECGCLYSMKTRQSQDWHALWGEV